MLGDLGTEQVLSAVGCVVFFLQMLLHPNSGAAGKDGAVEALRLAQYKAFYTTGRAAALQSLKSGQQLLEFSVPCQGWVKTKSD